MNENIKTTDPVKNMPTSSRQVVINESLEIIPSCPEVFNFIAKNITDKDIQNGYFLAYQYSGVSVFRIIYADEPYISMPIIVIAKPFPLHLIEIIKTNYETLDMPLQCGLCDGKFSQINIEMENALNNYAKKEKKFGWNKYQYVCNICKRANKSEQIMEEHILDHITNKELFCPFCKSTNPNVIDISNEKKKVQPPDTVSKTSVIQKETVKVTTSFPTLPFVYCQHCKTFLASGDELFAKFLNFGSNGHRKNSYICCICNQVIRDNQKKAEIHIGEHLTSPDIFCSECHSRNLDNLQIASDANKAKEEGKLIQCGKCNGLYNSIFFIFKNWVKVFQMKKVNDKNKPMYHYKCKLCGKEGYIATDMKDHLLDHVKENKIFCQQCRD